VLPVQIDNRNNFGLNYHRFSSKYSENQKRGSIMMQHVERQNQTKRCEGANVVAQKKGDRKQASTFVDNRSRISFKSAKSHTNRGSDVAQLCGGKGVAGLEIWNKIKQDIDQNKWVFIYGEEGAREQNRTLGERQGGAKRTEAEHVGHKQMEDGKAFGLTIDVLNNVIWRTGDHGVFGCWRDAKKRQQDVEIDALCIKRIADEKDPGVKAQCTSFWKWLTNNGCTPERILSDHYIHANMSKNMQGAKFQPAAIRNATSIDFPLSLPNVLDAEKEDRIKRGEEDKDTGKEDGQLRTKEEMIMKNVFNFYTMLSCTYGIRWIAEDPNARCLHFERGAGDGERQPLSQQDAGKVVLVREVPKMPITVVEAMTAFLVREGLNVIWYRDGMVSEPPWKGAEDRWKIAAELTGVDQMHERAAGKGTFKK
jgi:hypothetical protein